jgi:hypothetical protein
MKQFKLKMSQLIIAYSSLAFGLAMFVVLYTGWEIDEPGEWKPVLAMAICFTLASLYFIPACLVYKVETSSRGISQKQLFVREKHLNWKDVTEVSISLKTGILTIKDKHKKSLSVLRNVEKMPELIEVIKSSVKPEMIAFKD